ncbi:hypothetical protein CAF53_02285 [Sphingobium sp. LB126]|uniref:metallophosphoesterase n=1 Tax=Sphingobium sp. LB126 TaxID=1983755 RepID=UPI000C20401E|nr:metallophosphoesterase [Sphingobium sp. LB126]PJG47195.1 hypothetical protein CAF53_02285 [Sphingobium sp. LB126]
MLIAQISDFHVVTAGKLAYNRIDTGNMLRHAVNMINRLRPRPALVIGSGDLVQSGTTAEYGELLSILADLRAPFAPVMGNHDNRENFMMAFGSALQFGSGPFVQYVRMVGQEQVVILDSVTEGSGEPSFCAERVRWLDRILSASTRRSILVTHHPVFPTGISWMEPSDPNWSQLLGSVIADHRPQIIHLLSGHIHRAIHSRAFDLPASSCPSTAHQVALDFESEDALFSREAPGFQLHRVEDGMVTTYTASLDRVLDSFDPREG